MIELESSKITAQEIVQKILADGEASMISGRISGFYEKLHSGKCYLNKDGCPHQIASHRGGGGVNFCCGHIASGNSKAPCPKEAGRECSECFDPCIGVQAAQEVLGL